MKSTQELATRIDAAFASMKAKREQFQEVETQVRGVKQRFAKLAWSLISARHL